MVEGRGRPVVVVLFDGGRLVVVEELWAIAKATRATSTMQISWSFILTKFSSVMIFISALVGEFIVKDDGQID